MPKQIKQEELQEFWEWCGISRSGYWLYSPQGKHLASIYGKIPLDLNNLFKYAVPKVDIASIILYPATQDRWGCYFGGKYQNYNVAKTPAQALYQAIQKAREVTNAKTE